MALMLTILGVVLLIVGCVAAGITLLTMVVPTWGGGGPKPSDLLVMTLISAVLVVAGLALIIAN
jgi:hypothetical protein